VKVRDGNVIYDRVFSIVHLEELVRVASNLTEEQKMAQAEGAPMIMTLTQIQSLVLLQMLKDYKKEIDNELHMPGYVTDMMGKQVVSVEIVWQGSIERRFFHVPAMCANLVKKMRDEMVEYVERENQELKLEDFMRRSDEMYEELQHQARLVEIGVANIFSRKNQNKSTWCAFGLACTVNLVLLFHYKEANGTNCMDYDASDKAVGGSDGGPVDTCKAELSSDFFVPGITPTTVLMLLNGLQMLVGSFTLLLFLVVRAPVTYIMLRKAGTGKFMSFFWTVTDMQSTMYYCLYLMVCIVAFSNDAHILHSILLLDIIKKNSTVADVLKAIWHPWRPLMATIILLAISLYIFSFWLFMMFRRSLLLDECDSLINCLIATLTFGMRMGGGIGEHLGFNEKSTNSAPRVIYDMLFFVLVLIILLNIIFGIIIDTFADLRDQKTERLMDTVSVCFVCGLGKVDFDRAAGDHRGFRRHIQNDHNMWNYFKFMVLLWEQDKDDDDGLECYVRKCMDKHELNWFPTNRALCLIAKAEEEEEEHNTEGEKDHDQLMNAINTSVERLQVHMEQEIAKNSQEMKTAITAELIEQLRGSINKPRISLAQTHA